MSKTYAPVYPHDPIEELFEDVFWVHGSIRMGPGLLINRNMVVLRDGGELTLLGPVRLSDEGLEQLAELGEVKHVVRVGYFHGCDDQFYVDRYKAKFWCQEGSDNYPSPKPDEVIEQGTKLPAADTEAFVFRKTKSPECAILHRRHGGLLVTGDSVQHHVDTSRCSLLAKGVMYAMGFMKPANIGPPWRKTMTKEGESLKADFDNLLDLDFDHLVGAHGSVCRGGAKDALATTVRRVFAD